MATKAAIEKSENRSGLQQSLSGPIGTWNNFVHFLSDVRGEMRKVTTPTRKEVQVTTWVVLIAVFLFGLFFFIVDNIFSAAIMGPHGILSKLGGLQ